MEVGTLANIKGIIVTDVFAARILIRAPSKDSAWIDKNVHL